MAPIIHIENISKKYLIGHQSREKYLTLRDRIGNMIGSMGKKRQGRYSEEFWALQDISFEVNQGESVGIIGPNGAGKSTLLKILSRITEPTTGRVTLNGRVASLLEVGTGFHPELTGRENIFLNGAILGMRKADIIKKFDEIVAFSEVEKFLDTPVKRYSSGMYVRLAFAVAAHLEPEILVVDEVLAVGDAQFQKKCLGKMDDVARNHGRTVLFVSHNMQAIQNLCSTGILLKNGKMEKKGNVLQVVSTYLGTTVTQPNSRERRWGSPDTAPGNETIRVHGICIKPDGPGQTQQITMNAGFTIEILFWNMVSDLRLVVNLCLYTVEDTPCLESLSVDEKEWNTKPFSKGLYRSACHIPAYLLNQGTYRVRIFFLNDSPSTLFDFRDAMFFSVEDLDERNLPWYGKFIGVVHPRLQWETEKVRDEADTSINKLHAGG